jgi:acyl carrier protein
MSAVTQDIKTQIRQFILDNFVMGAKGLQLSDTDSFMERHIIDSTGFLELVTYLEETFGIQVADDDLVPENLDSLNSLEGYVGRKLNA